MIIFIGVELLDNCYCCSVTQPYLTLCDPMDCSLPGFPVHHHLLKFVQSHVHWVSDAIQPSCPLVPFSSCLQSFLASGSFLMSRIFSNGSALCSKWPKIWSFTFSINPSNEYSEFIYFRTDWFDLLESKDLSRVFSNTTVQKHQFFSVQPSLRSNSHIHTWLLEKP